MRITLGKRQRGDVALIVDIGISTPVASFLGGTIQSALIIIIGCTLLAGLGFLFVVRFLPRARQEEQNAILDHVLGVIGTLYAVLLAFVVVTTWQDFTEADTIVQTESAQISNLLRQAAAFPPKVRDEIRHDLIVYLNDVATKEWKTLAFGDLEATTEGAYEKVWADYIAFKPVTEQNQLVYEQSLERLGQAGQARLERHLISQTSVPLPLWILILAGGVLTVTLTFFFWTYDVRRQLTVVASLAALMGFVFFLIYSLEHPFAGSIKVSPEGFSVLADYWESGGPGHCKQARTCY